jgi:hypothetical protein
MNDEQGKTAEADRDMGSDVERAAAILRQAGEDARRQLTLRYPVLFTTWGLMYLLGYGVLWLSLLALTIIAAVAVAVTVILVGRAVSGIGGTSARQRTVYILASIAGFAGLFTLEAALAHAGASKAVIGVYGAAAPILLTGLIYAVGAAIALDWTVFGLGLWLVAVAAGGAFAGPVGVWAVDALAGGAAFLAMAAVRLIRRS